MMEIGFLPEVGHQGMTGLTCWHPGAAELKTFLGLNTGSVRVDWKQVYAVTTYRCPRCGLLRSYAHPKPEDA
jgi:hypothetical protein